MNSYAFTAAHYLSKLSIQFIFILQASTTGEDSKTDDTSKISQRHLEQVHDMVADAMLDLPPASNVKGLLESAFCCKCNWQVRLLPDEAFCHQCTAVSMSIFQVNLGWPVPPWRPCVGPGQLPLTHSLPHLLLCLLVFTFPCSYLLYLFSYFSISSFSTRIDPLCFQAGGRRRQPNLGLVFLY